MSKLRLTLTTLSLGVLGALASGCAASTHPVQAAQLGAPSSAAALEALGSVTTPTLSDLFVALMSRDSGVN